MGERKGGDQQDWQRTRESNGEQIKSKHITDMGGNAVRNSLIYMINLWCYWKTLFFFLKGKQSGPSDTLPNILYPVSVGNHSPGFREIPPRLPHRMTLVGEASLIKTTVIDSDSSSDQTPGKLRAESQKHIRLINAIWKFKWQKEVSTPEH